MDGGFSTYQLVMLPKGTLLERLRGGTRTVSELLRKRIIFRAAGHLCLHNARPISDVSEGKTQQSLFLM